MGNSDSRRKLWAERTANGMCIYCGLFPSKQDSKGCDNCLKKKVDATVKFGKNNPETSKQYRLLVKHEVIEKYGGKCACCGEENILFLTIDHINNDGNQDRLEMYGVKNPPTSSWYLKLRREPIREDLQALCFNCNLGKSLNDGVCPHEKINKLLSPVYDRRHDSQFDKRLKIVWPLDEELIAMCNATSVSQVSKGLGVDFSAISGRLKRRKKYDLVEKKYKMSANKKKIRQQFRDICFARDKYTCVMCGKKSSCEKVLEELDCHHITDRGLMPSGGFVKENGISLCPECHQKAEEYHSTGTAHPGYAPDELYKKINSTLEKAIEASQKLKI